MKALPILLLPLMALVAGCSAPGSAGLTAEGEQASRDLRSTSRRPAPAERQIPALRAAAMPQPRPTEPSGSSTFPLAPGTTWTYQGQVKWTNAETQRIEEKSVVWTMEIVETLTRGYVLAAVVRGHPSDLAHFREGRAPGTYVIVRVGLAKFYLLKSTRAPEALARLRDADDLLHNLVYEDEIFLDAPLAAGKVFGETGQLTRQDASYLWVVEEERISTLENVKGVRPARRTVFRLLYRTLPDREEIEFVPEVGIIRYAYAHHGTVSEADVRLVEYQAGKE